ncbi:hypothetical protein SRB5_14200 [Streptomyces sp. RB5]|uniref:UPF0336 protein SRB5_14200 n=1 Tax=Streptomyces smaragdinus TaxID=2585196 RepID=A0A7K0CCW6_9ACTN|nr:MaoC family dehydratase N-terminal domain-containing protein [Streptomyces smaragdinus]MQY11305.1 hypothetical protein [Streptomyces smaragdinus]
MGLSPTLAGRTYPAAGSYDIDREKIREFAKAVGETSPAHHDPAAARALGHPDVIAPVTFLAVLTQTATDPVIYDPVVGLDYSRVVHRDQRFVLHRPVVAGDRLRSFVRIDAVRSLAGNDVLELGIDLRDPEEKTVATVFMSLVVRAPRE